MKRLPGHLLEELMQRQPKGPEEIGDDKPFLCTRCGNPFTPDAEGFVDRDGLPVHARCGERGELQEYKDANMGLGYRLSREYFAGWW
jgi:hypothetical protein